MSYVLHLQPRQTSISRPSASELRELLVSLPRPAVSEISPLRFSFTERDGESVEVLLEGTADAVERVKVEKPGADIEIAHTHELCASIAEALDWEIFVPGTHRALSVTELGCGTVAVRRRDMARWRRSVMLLAASVVFPAALLWHLGGRVEGLWLSVAVSGTAVYFLLRIWGALEKRLRR